MADDTRDKLQALMEEYKNSDPANNVRQQVVLQDDNEHRNLTQVYIYARMQTLCLTKTNTRVIVKRSHDVCVKIQWRLC